MKQMGSLYEFMQLSEIPGPTAIDYNSKNSKSLSYNNNKQSASQSPHGIILNYSMPGNPQQKYNQNFESKARAKTNIDVQNYKPSVKKSMRKQQTVGNQSQVGTQAWKQLINRYKMNKYYQQERINSLLPRKIRVIQLQTKNRLNIDQSLLRALEKIKVNEDKQGKQQLQQRKSQHVSSLANHADALSQLKLIPFQNAYSQKNINNSMNEDHKYILKAKKSRSSLSDSKRIQFQRCLSWSKKHHKDGKYYKKQLGKTEPEQKQDWSHQVKKRKNLLSILGQKYNNNHILSQSINHNRQQSMTSSRLLLRESRNRCENHERRESIAEALKDKQMKKREAEKNKSKEERIRALTKVDERDQQIRDLRKDQLKRGKSLG